MSLDIYLKSKMPIKAVCHHCGSEYETYETIFTTNITHNLATMANAAGLFDALWKPSEHGFHVASELIPVLECGIADMKSRPEYYQQFNPSNGWGSYDRFLPWLEELLVACREHPEAAVEAFP